MAATETHERPLEGGTVPSERALRRRVLHPVKAPLRAARRAYRSTTSAGRVLPDVLLIGAQKAGTTSLYGYLAAHPAVLPSLVKEVHYFDLNAHRDERWYRAHFPTEAQRRRATLATGVEPRVLEGSPYYLFHPLAPHRVRRLLPDVSLIAVLRDPVDRAVSQHNQSVALGFETLPFEEAIAREAERLQGEVKRLLSDPRYRSFSHQRHSYLARGRYADQLELWLSLFDREQLLVLDSERLGADPDGTLGRVSEFLGLPFHPLPRYEKAGVRHYPDIDPGLRARLREYFAPHNERLRELTGEDFGWAR